MTDLTEIYCLGISHHRAPVKVRELLAFSQADQLRLYSRARHSADLSGFVLLSTCNRVEFYYSAQGGPASDGRATIERVLTEFGHPLETFHPYLYTLQGNPVAEHLARVASGLDALVLGEAEILGQVDRALRTAEDQDTADVHLTSLFRFAIGAGRKARAETGINEEAVSVSSVAVRRAERSLGGMSGRTAAILGLGETGNIVFKLLRRRDLERLFLINRTPGVAEARAEQRSHVACSIVDLPDVLRQADVVFTCTGCPRPMIDREMVRLAIADRADRPLLLVDLAVPHDIEPDVADLDGVEYVNIDALNEQVSDSMQRRTDAVPHVETVLEAELKRFARRREEMRVQPLITDLRKQAEFIRREEVARLSRRLPDLPDEVQEQIERFSHSLVKRLFHNPTLGIRREAVDGDPDDLARTVRNLFRIQDRAS